MRAGFRSDPLSCSEVKYWGFIMCFLTLVFCLTTLGFRLCSSYFFMSWWPWRLITHILNSWRKFDCCGWVEYAIGIKFELMWRVLKGLKGLVFLLDHRSLRAIRTSCFHFLYTWTLRASEVITKGHCHQLFKLLLCLDIFFLSQ